MAFKGGSRDGARLGHGSKAVLERIAAAKNSGGGARFVNGYSSSDGRTGRILSVSNVPRHCDALVGILIVS
jgi:hypothetical protein